MKLVARWTVVATDANQCAQALPIAGSAVTSPFKIDWLGRPHHPSPTTFANTAENWTVGASPTVTLPASSDAGSFAGALRTFSFTLASNPCTATTPVHAVAITGFTGGSMTLG
jgi:hypothetical protein